MNPLAVLLPILAAPAQSDERNEPRDCELVVLGEIFTADPERPRAGALAIRGERIVAVGDRETIAPLIGPGTRTLSTEGSVLPGFNDAHCHFTVGFGLRRDLDVSDAESLEEILARVRDHARSHPEAEVIQGAGWDLADMPDHAFPTAAHLDEVVPDRPVLLWSEGPHGLWVNSAALERAGIDAGTREPPATTFLRDASGAPSGVFLGRGLFGLFRFVPFPDLDVLREGIRAGLGEASRLGVTSVHDSVPTLLLPYLAELFDAGELTVRFHVWGAQERGPFGGGPDDHERQAKLHGREDWITFGTLKGGVDGMPGLRTAALLEPYADDPATSGLLTADAQRLDAAVAEANARGLRVALHATGDAGVRTALEAFAGSRPAPEKRIRNRIEHAFLIAPDDVERLAATRTIVSVQPAFLSVDLAKDRFYERRFGPRRCASVLPLRSLLDAGVTLAFGTDFSLTPLDPRVGLYAAVARRTLDGWPSGGWHSEQRISLAEAVRAYTLGSALAEGAGESKGMLREGRLADLVVFSEDLFALPPDEILGAEIDATIVGGRIVHRRGD